MSEGGLPPYKRAFVTSSYWAGNLKVAGGGATGVAGADNLCAKAAVGAHLGGSWKAWLSDSKTNAVDRLADVGVWRLVTGAPLVGKAALASKWADYIGRDEHGETAEGSGLVWTGTDSSGQRAAATCVDWTSDAVSVSGHAGRLATFVGDWTDFEDASCDVPRRLYCFEQ